MSRIDLIKIDAEGFEEKIIESSLDAIINFKPILALECSHKDSFLNKLFNIGYKPYYIVNNQLVSSFDKSLLTIDQIGNLILIHN